MLETHPTKAVVAGGSNNARVWWQSTQPPRAGQVGFGRRAPDSAAILKLFSQNTHFWAYFVLNFCLKPRF